MTVSPKARKQRGRNHPLFSLLRKGLFLSSNPALHQINRHLPQRMEDRFPAPLPPSFILCRRRRLLWRWPIYLGLPVPPTPLRLFFPFPLEMQRRRTPLSIAWITTSGPQRLRRRRQSRFLCSSPPPIFMACDAMSHSTLSPDQGRSPPTPSSDVALPFFPFPSPPPLADDSDTRTVSPFGRPR